MSIQIPRIGVYAIMKDETVEQVQGWANSVRDADRVTLVDTGSKDAGIQHLASHVISVQPFRFEVARNTALSLVPPDLDICISLDLDERLGDGWKEALMEAWDGRNPTKAQRYAVTYNTPGLLPFTHNSRVHSRAGFMWKEPCHEAIYASMMPDETIDVPAFVIDHSPDRAKSRTSYLNLLAHGIHEEPWNSRRMFYYARELLVYHHYEQALGWFEKYKEIWEAEPAREMNWEISQVLNYIIVARGAIKERDAQTKITLPSENDLAKQQ